MMIIAPFIYYVSNINILNIVLYINYNKIHNKFKFVLMISDYTYNSRELGIKEEI